MITMSKYKQLSYNFSKPFVVYKGIRYHLSTIDNETIVEDGMIELYNLMKKEENKIRKQVKSTTKNYKCIEEFLGVNPEHKSISCNYIEIKRNGMRVLKHDTKTPITGIEYSRGEHVNITKMMKFEKKTLNHELKPMLSRKYINNAIKLVKCN